MSLSPVEESSPDALDERAVAVVGMACRLPGAPDVRAFRALLRAGLDGISRLTPEELMRRGVDPAYAGRENFVPVMGVIEDSRRFDWPFFRYSRAEAAAMDPQQRVFLECAATAVDDAGLDPVRFRGRVGVYAGADRSGPGRADAELNELARYIGREKDFVATRVAYKLGLRGPALTVQSACSTSLTAVHLAVRALRGGECEVALAGGVTVMPAGEWGYLFEPGGILAPDGYCRPFDARSAGTVPSEGVGVVVLKRLVDAVRDGDRIAAVIAGTAVNNDGAEKMAYTAPSATGQSEVIAAALEDARLPAAAVGHVEAHGTATQLGDPIEVQALTEVFAASGACALGAVKGQVGHTGAAAGVTGLIKTALMLEHREIYPTAHFTEPNPLLELESSPFHVATRLTPWELRASQALRVGAVSSFGVGGTNAHAVLAEAPAVAQQRRPAAGPRLLPLSAHSPAALSRLCETLADRFTETDAPCLGATERTLAGRRIHRHRQAVVVRDTAHAEEVLRSAARQPGTPGTLGHVAFLFPGQGTLKNAAGEAAYRLLPEFRAAIDEIRKIAYNDCGVELAPVIDPAAPGLDGAREGDDWYADTVHQQLGLFALGHAFGQQLAAWGVIPHAMLGNSIGEYAAAALAGVWDLPDAVGLVHRRAVAMRESAPGRMAVVEADPADLDARLPVDCGVTVAVRGNGSAVLAGTEAALDRLLAGDALSGLRVTPVHTRRAFHSPAMNPAAEAVRNHLSSMSARPPRLPHISNTSGDWADADAVTTPGHWAAHLREPVRLDTGTATLLAAGCTTYVELGPGGSMTGSLRAAPGWDPAHRTVRLAPGGRTDAETGLLDALGTLWELGVDQALETLLRARYADPAERPVRCSLPGHPYLGEDPETAQAPGRDEKRQAAQLPGQEPQNDSRAHPHPGGARSLRTVLEDAWCQTLGVTSVSDADDFFALGGESLLALALATTVRERVGVEVSVTDFTRKATFAALVELVERRLPTKDGPAALPPGVATLREGEGRPVFLVADALGNALPYRELAAAPHATRGRPLLALERSAARGGTIHTLAAAHARTLLTAQPTGPYTLGGWSFGGVVAHETARLLARRGRTVDLLILLDGYLPDTRPLPVAAAPDFLLGGARAGLDTLLGTGPTAGPLCGVPGGRRRFLGGQAAVLAHRPGPARCPAVLFKADADQATAARLHRRLAGLYPAGLRVVPVPGDHWSMLRPPYVDRLAAHIGEELAALATHPRHEEHKERKDS